MKAHEQVTFSNEIAWIPVKTQDSGWVWLHYVDVITDHRPEIFLGLLPTKEYFIDGWEHYKELINDIEDLKVDSTK